MNTDKIYAEHIANEYSAKQESKVIALKKLDRRAKLPADIFVYTNGIIMSLVLGVGMCLSMGVIGGGNYMVLGIIIGTIGIIGVSSNYFSYKRILKKSKEKYAQDIIRLANQIAEDED
ncbi:MAG: dihydropteridine reductase [Acutalibacteraceae bacterium]